jgi:hypothetical protein
MINLIPPKEKERILMERINKVIIIHWFLIFFFIICFVLVLFSIKIYFKSQALTQDSVVSSAKSGQEQERVGRFKEEMRITNEKINEQNNYLKNRIYFSSIIERIAGVLPEKLKLSTLSAVLDSEKKIIKVFVSGFVLEREDLVVFKEKLEKEESISEISFPASNWVRASNINFSATFNIKP